MRNHRPRSRSPNCSSRQTAGVAPPVAFEVCGGAHLLSRSVAQPGTNRLIKAFLRTSRVSGLKREDNNGYPKKFHDSRCSARRRHFAGSSPERSPDRRSTTCRYRRPARTWRNPARCHGESQSSVGSSADRRRGRNSRCASRAPRKVVHAGTAHDSGMRHGSAGHWDMRLRYGR
jgi:hypothetical protein